MSDDIESELARFTPLAAPQRVKQKERLMGCPLATPSPNVDVSEQLSNLALSHRWSGRPPCC